MKKLWLAAALALNVGVTLAQERAPASTPTKKARAELLAEIKDFLALIPPDAADKVSVTFREKFKALRTEARSATSLKPVKARFKKDKNDYLNARFAVHHAEYEHPEDGGDINKALARFEDDINRQRDLIITLRKLAENKDLKLNGERLRQVAGWQKQLNQTSAPVDLIAQSVGAQYMRVAPRRIEIKYDNRPLQPVQRAPEAGLSEPATPTTTAASASSWFDLTALKKLAVTAYNNVAGTIGQCYSGVKDALVAAHLVKAYPPGVAADSFNNLVREEPQLFARKLKKLSPAAWPLPVGTIVVWDRSTRHTKRGRKYGHIEIITRVSLPLACSDHCQEFNTEALMRYSGTGRVNAYVIEKPDA